VLILEPQSAPLVKKNQVWMKFIPMMRFDLTLAMDILVT